MTKLYKKLEVKCKSKNNTMVLTLYYRASKMFSKYSKCLSNENGL